jgi:hypothetical protein
MNLLPKSSIEVDVLRQSNKVFVFLAIIGLFIVCIIGFYIVEFIPRFVTLPINLPKDDYGKGNWSSTTYSVVNQGPGRVFTWRSYGYVGYANTDKFTQLGIIREYFYNNMVNKLGWVAGENNELCNMYLPEASLLVERQDGVVLQFQEKGHPVYSTGDYFGDLVCVSILGVDLSNSEPDQIFDITILTARQSPMKILFDYIDAL